jgi:hypothetical protein
MRLLGNQVLLQNHKIKRDYNHNSKQTTQIAGAFRIQGGYPPTRVQVTIRLDQPGTGGWLGVPKNLGGNKRSRSLEF